MTIQLPDDNIPDSLCVLMEPKAFGGGLVATVGVLNVIDEHIEGLLNVLKLWEGRRDSPIIAVIPSLVIN